MGIGKTLSDILDERKCNPNELADKIGVSPSTIYSIIKRDNMKVDITVLAKICEVLNVKMERFYTEYLAENTKPQIVLNDEERILLSKYNNLNSRGKEKLLDYADDLICSGNYSKVITVVEAARSQNNDEPVKTIEVSEDDMAVFDIAPQSDELL